MGLRLLGDLYGGERAGGGCTVVGFQISDQHGDRIADFGGRSRVPAPLQKSFTLLGFRTDSQGGGSPGGRGVGRSGRGLRLRRLAADHPQRQKEEAERERLPCRMMTDTLPWPRGFETGAVDLIPLVEEKRCVRSAHSSQPFASCSAF